MVIFRRIRDRTAYVVDSNYSRGVLASTATEEIQDCPRRYSGTSPHNVHGILSYVQLMPNTCTHAWAVVWLVGTHCLLISCHLRHLHWRYEVHLVSCDFIDTQ